MEEITLVDTQLTDLMRDGCIEFEMSLKESLKYIQPASVDIPVGSTCYLVKEKVLPFGKTVAEILPEIVLEKKNIDKEEGIILLKGQTYLVKSGIVELAEGNRGSLSSKSSIGRVDLMVRGVYDCCGLYDTIPSGQSGELWLEISPRSFNIRIKRGIALSQLMILSSEPTRCCDVNQAPLNLRNFDEPLLYSHDEKPLQVKTHKGAMILSLNVTGGSEDEDVEKENKDGNSSLKETNGKTSAFNRGQVVGYEALPTNEVIDLSLRGALDPTLYFRPVFWQANSKSLTLEKDKFYILATKERIRIPIELSAEMVPFSQHVGELRAHYAGFFDPGFGYGNNGELKGAAGVLEVRPHETITVYDGQPICLMEFFRNAENPRVPYGSAGNNYQSQCGPKLAKYFNNDLIEIH